MNAILFKGKNKCETYLLYDFGCLGNVCRVCGVIKVTGVRSRHFHVHLNALHWGGEGYTVVTSVSVLNLLKHANLSIK